MSDPDWRERVLSGGQRLEVSVAPREDFPWPGYRPQPAVSAWRLPRAVAAVWDFTVFGGSFGEHDATVLAAAVEIAIRDRLPLLTLVRSGGTRLQEGIAALVGIPRARLALADLARARLAHVSVADAPTTGGVWVAVSSTADLRVAVAGATVAFAGPRVVEAFTGELPSADSHTAESAHRAGLVDALLAGPEVADWLDRVLLTLGAAQQSGTVGPQPPEPEAVTRGGWEQVLASRARRQGGQDLLNELLDSPVPLRAARGDDTVTAQLGRLGGRPCVAVALAARPGKRPTAEGYRLAARAYLLADRLDLPVLSLVDTPGADPGTRNEEAGLAAAIGAAQDALLGCRTPTLAFVHGEGGSGGALAAATADRLLMATDSYFAAIGPEGAAAALRRPAQECADAMGITPANLRASGFADALAHSTDLPWHLSDLAGQPAAERLARRDARWRHPLPG